MPEKNIYLRALDAEQQGDWKRAHEMVQDMVTAEAAWVHDLTFMHDTLGCGVYVRYHA